MSVYFEVLVAIVFGVGAVGLVAVMLAYIVKVVEKINPNGRRH